MNILSIDTSCDETAVAVTDGTTVVSNVIWSQASLHAKFGGVFPSLAQRQHEERIDWVINKALGKKLKGLKGIDAIAVTYGPGLAIALGVGINKAKELAKMYNKPLIPVNHVESHLLSPLAKQMASSTKSQFLNSKQLPKDKLQFSNSVQNTKKQINKLTDLRSAVSFPAFGLVLSGKNTQFVLIEEIGKYKILADVVDDALGEALDKSARLLGFGYPGGPVLEEFAKNGNPEKYNLPLPLKGDKVKNRFSYSGLKTAFVRLLNEIGDPTPKEINNLAASFQKAAFDHIINVVDNQISNHQSLITNHLLFGGGVANNMEIRKRLRKLCKMHNLELLLPYSKKLTTDNAAMVGICAYLKIKNENLNVKKFMNYDKIDRNARAKIT